MPAKRPMTEKPIAYEAYQKLADHYASHIDTKPHNAYYDRPAMLSLLPEVTGKRVLDAGCGPGVYAEELVKRGASVVSIDASERMLELAQNRLQNSVQLKLVDMSKPLDIFSNQEFDVINAPLCLDYIENWTALFKEFRRILKPGGTFLFSVGHPFFDANYFRTDDYFSVEQVECTWTGFGIDISMPSYRRSLQEVIMPVLNAGLILEQVLEPLPTDAFKEADPRRYKNLMHRPCFLCIKAKRP